MVGGTRLHRWIQERALVRRKKKILRSKNRTSHAARKLKVSLDRADAVIEGAAALRLLQGCAFSASLSIPPSFRPHRTLRHFTKGPSSFNPRASNFQNLSQPATIFPIRNHSARHSHRASSHPATVFPIWNSSRLRTLQFPTLATPQLPVWGLVPPPVQLRASSLYLPEPRLPLMRPR